MPRTLIHRVEARRAAKEKTRPVAWLCELRAQGIKALKTIHELRKEVGSFVANHKGIYAASRYLRHGDITITFGIYVEKKEKGDAEAEGIDLVREVRSESGKGGVAGREAMRATVELDHAQELIACVV